MSLRSWARSLFTPATRTIRKAPRRARLALESLEDRTVPTTFTVLNGLDDGDGSLRAAIAAADNNPGSDDINFDPGVTAVTLTSGQLNIASELAIAGPAAKVTITRDPTASEFGILDIAPGASVTLSYLTISGGDAGATGKGGGIANRGNTTLTSCTVSGNTAVLGAGYGGGVYGSAGSKTTLNDCTVSYNRAIYGGGVDNYGTLELNRCNLSNNTADHGGALENDAGTATLTDCNVSGNTSTFYGGGLYLRRGAQTTLTNCTVSGNKATSTTSRGGGVYNRNSDLTLQNCSVSGNSAVELGGGLFTFDSQNTLTSCAVSGNSASKGGGVFAELATVKISNSTLSGNKVQPIIGSDSKSFVGSGGGVYLTASDATLTNCTLSGNSATNKGGGLWMRSTSSSPRATATLVNCTISGNTANYGGGLYRGLYARMTLGSTIVAGNTATTKEPDVDAHVTSVISLGRNLIGNIDGSTGWISGSDRCGTPTAPLNPLLGPLADNGGPLVGAPGSQQVLQTMALLPGSPAINAGSSAGLAEVQTVTVTGSSGAFTLTFNGQTTSAIAFNASAATVQAALNGLSSIGGVGGSVTVTKSGSVFTITFGGSLSLQNVPQITAAGSSGVKTSVATLLDGGTVDIGAI